MKTALSIAGSDSSGGAGIQADIKTMTMNGVYAMSAVTALTAQNTTGVAGILESAPDFLNQQLDCIFQDIRPDAVKIGMVSSPELAEVIADRLTLYRAVNIVVDPVMYTTSGTGLSRHSAVRVMEDKVFHMAAVITPNIPEAEALTGMRIIDKSDMEQAAKELGDRYRTAILCKGGHRSEDADDVLYFAGEFTWFESARIDNPNTHGTGCTLSSAVAANLAKSCELPEAVRRSKAYVSGALNSMLDLGAGSGPLNHAFELYGRINTFKK